jgi:hypothetical protein
MKAGQMTITELEKEFLAAINALGMLSYSIYSGTLRGERVLRGPHVNVTFPAEMRMTKCLRKKLRRLVRKFYGPCKRPVVIRGSFRGYIGETLGIRHRQMAIEFIEGVK